MTATPRRPYRPWLVLYDGDDGPDPSVAYGRYATEEQAEAAVNRLRVLGHAATVERSEVER